MKKSRILLLIKFTAALCSIAYELILAQTLTAFLSNTVLRYCVTIGLYLLCMGLGAFFIEKRMAKAPWLVFWQTEVALTFVGAGAVPFLFIIDVLPWGTLTFLVAAHALICLIGFLTGFELPLSMELAKRDGLPKRNSLFTVDYLGAFAGTVAFALVFYPRMGLVAAAWSVSLLNSVAACALALAWREERGMGRVASVVSFVLLAAAVAGLWTASVQEQYLIGHYLR